MTTRPSKRPPATAPPAIAAVGGDDDWDCGVFFISEEVTVDEGALVVDAVEDERVDDELMEDVEDERVDDELMEDVEDDPRLEDGG